jgi:hypothetical protein
MGVGGQGISENKIFERLDFFFYNSNQEDGQRERISSSLYLN